MSNNQLVRELYQKWVSQNATPEEESLFFELLSNRDIRRELEPLMRERWLKHSENAQRYPEAAKQKILRNILDQYPSPVAEPEPIQIKSRSKNKFLLYAAVLLGLMIAGTYLKDILWHKAEEGKTTTLQAAIQPIVPGYNKAILQTANGHQVSLDSLGKGKITTKNGHPVFQKENGELIALVNSGNRETLNTINVPRGGMFQVTLPDGTEVWLNAASSITFPSVFETTERMVQVTGEVYFEVAKDKTRPFRIGITNDIQLEVLGTRFNVNAYQDESTVKTTLVEGSVAVKNRQLTSILKPGQQARIGMLQEGGTTITDDVDMHSVLAWKNDEFYFGEKTDIKSVMRQIARWYDVEVEYRSRVEGYFGGSVSRKAGIQKTMQMIQKAGGFNLKTEGRKIVVE